MSFEQAFETRNSLKTSPKTQLYHDQLMDQVTTVLSLANKARERGHDPTKEVEIFIAQDVASRTEGLVGPKGVAKRLKEMEEIEKISKDKIVVDITKEITQGRFIPGSPERLAEQAIRTALSYQTEGITAAPIEGIGRVKIKTNPDGTQYLAVYYSGPIRSAGGTAQGVSVFIADLIRKELGLARYKATEEEVERMLEEVRLYNQIMHLQLPTSDEEIRHAWKNIPVMITGDPTESDEVGGYRNIESMDTNKVRGGACLVLNDGLVGRAKKITKRIKKLQIEGWSWLEEIADGKFTDKRATEVFDEDSRMEVQPDYSFVSDALMGRPTISGPTTEGGFRLRYGRARNTGIAGIGIHPAIMAVVNDFLASGTHVRTERPGKGSIVTPVNSIEPPIVLLKNGDVVTINTYDRGVEIRDSIEQVLFLGDMLVGFGEFIQNNYRLCPAGFNEEWWALTLWNTDWEGKEVGESIEDFVKRMIHWDLSSQEAIDISKTMNIPLHPKYLPWWNNISVEEATLLQRYLKQSTNGILPFEVKSIMEKLFVPHTVEDNALNVGELFVALEVQLSKDLSTVSKNGNTIDVINEISEVKVKDKGGTTVGARMGRPEKAKARMMKPQLHGLFPLGSDKKVGRTLSKAIEEPYVKVKLGNRYCTSCNIAQYQLFCKECKQPTVLQGYCANPQCRTKMDEEPCDVCGSRVNFTRFLEVNIPELLDATYQRLGQISRLDVKLKDQLKNPYGISELIDKGILRAKYNLNVFRDGTVRYDATDAPLTHFYPREIGTDIEKLVNLGYTHDVSGNKLINQDQLLELKTQDIILHESSAAHLNDVSQFIDDELALIYNLPRFYNITSRMDLIGNLVIGLAPHTSAGVIGRIIGFTRSSVCWAHPFWHAAKRRNCDGDEDGIILLLDGFLNFSKNYLPSTRGSKMDTPLVLVVTLNPNEVDDEAFNMDCVTTYPLELYHSAEKFKMPAEIMSMIHRAENRLGYEIQYEGFVFSHSTDDMSAGPLTTRYKDPKLTIRNKLDEQLTLADKIQAVDAKETALKILERHVLPDLIGNLRAFASQKVRCISCNTKYRRVPLSGKCTNQSCERSNLVLTVPPKGVTKYFDICEKLIMDYNLGKYHEDRLERIKIALESHFPDKGPKQLDLTDWL
ncbi:MAG: DNA polymerase II large subunit [Candidatus Kariarchaeaceae archaeon]|jgi:DNA polymerase II large subunit